MDLQQSNIEHAPPLRVEWRGRERFADTWARQLELHALRKAGEIPDSLILVEHEPVITLGRHGDSANLLLSEAALAERGIDLFRIERGGDITYHGPGQLVGYPIFNLRELGINVHRFVWSIEEALIRATAAYGVEARRVQGLTGVWVEAATGAGLARPAQPGTALVSGPGMPGPAAMAKLAAIGVAIQGGVSYHGFAYNISTDLSGFQTIVPCGITQYGVTSLSELLGAHISMAELSGAVVRSFTEVFGFSLTESTPASETSWPIPVS